MLRQQVFTKKPLARSKRHCKPKQFLADEFSKLPTAHGLITVKPLSGRTIYRMPAKWSTNHNSNLRKISQSRSSECKSLHINHLQAFHFTSSLTGFIHHVEILERRKEVPTGGANLRIYSHSITLSAMSCFNFVGQFGWSALRLAPLMLTANRRECISIL